MVEIRKVTGGDEKNLAYIQTESWKAAFRGILPPETLDGCTNFSKAEAMYRKLLEEKKGNGYILEIDHRPHCIAWWDAAREEAMAGYAELICIHSLPENWHCGYGSKMMDAVLADSQRPDIRKSCCGCLSRMPQPLRSIESTALPPAEESSLPSER